MRKPRTKEELEAALEKLKAEYNYFCGATSQKAAQAAAEIDERIANELGWRGAHLAQRARRYVEIETVAQYRAKIKTLYWALGEPEAEL